MSTRRDRIQRGDEPPAARDDASPIARHRHRRENARRKHDQQLRAGSTDVPCSEDAQRRTRKAAWKPRGVPRNAGGKTVARQTEEDRADEEVAVRGRLAEEVRRHRRAQQQQAQYAASAVHVCPDAEVQPQHRSGQDRRGDQPFELYVTQAQVPADWNPEHAQHQPDIEQQREGGRGKPQHTLARTGRLCLSVTHNVTTISPSSALTRYTFTHSPGSLPVPSSKLNL